MSSLDPLKYPQPGDILDNGRTVGIEQAAGYTNAATPANTATPGTPDWWLKRLSSRLSDRITSTDAIQQFCDGTQPLMFASQKFVQTYGSRFGDWPANFMPLVIDAERERLIVEGFRFGTSPDADKGVWRIWQANQMDAESQIAHEIALTKGVAFAAVDPFSDKADVSITIEDPSEVIVETAPGNRRIRLAALKVIRDDDGYNLAWLYLPDVIYRFRSRVRRSDSTGLGLAQTDWVAYEADGIASEQRNPLGVVPIVPLINRPRRNGIGRSEVEPVIGNQLAINFLRYAALVGSDVAALPQRWAKNLDLEVDEDTGQVKVPFRSGRDTLWVTARPTPEEVADYGGTVPAPEFGQFTAASLDPFVSMIEEEIGVMASNSRTPYHYLLGSPTSVPPSGESLKSSEAPLVKKVIAQEVHFGEGWEETMRVALLAAGQTSKAKASTSAETIWSDPETRNEAARTDSVLKQFISGLLPPRFALTELGYSPQQVDRIMEEKAALPPAPQPSGAPVPDVTVPPVPEPTA